VKLAYFVHDLADPAVARRVAMLRAGGAQPVVLGFRRTETAPATVGGAPAFDLGRTHDGRFVQRAWATLRAAIAAHGLREHIARSDVILARTLEMLAVARAARSAAGLDTRLVYECLDIHRLMLLPGLKGIAMRAVERGLMRDARLLIVSSPGFLEHYFEPLQGVGDRLDLPTMLVENKALELGGDRTVRPAGPRAGAPWRIAWLGAIRCQKSLDILTDVARRRPDLLRVAIHGRPAQVEFRDFEAQVADAPGVTFGGPYGAADLSRLYADAHFSWAIDFMEEGQNSAWLLPNRLYEASRYGAVPIALAGVQTGRYLAEHGFGVRLETAADLEAFLEGLTAKRYVTLRRELEAVPLNAFVADEADCRMLVRALGSGLIPYGAAMESPMAKLVA
jgi:hypothetical protein